MFNCVYCKASISLLDKFCGNCGKNDFINIRMKCSGCGSIIFDDENFCTGCGRARQPINNIRKEKEVKKSLWLKIKDFMNW